MNPRFWLASVAVALSLGAAGCDGYVSGPPGQAGQPPPGGLGAPGSAGASNPGASGVGATLPSGCDAKAPLRRLTNFEYARTLHDLFPGFDLGKTGEAIPGD